MNSFRAIVLDIALEIDFVRADDAYISAAMTYAGRRILGNPTIRRLAYVIVGGPQD